MLDTKFELRMVDVKIKCLIDEIDMDIDFSRKIRYESLVNESNEKIKELERYKEKLTVIKSDLKKIEGDIDE